MASKKKVKKNISSAAAEKSLESAISTLNDLVDSTAKAINAVDKDKKTLISVAKRLGKKRATLTKRKKLASAKVKKDASAENKKALKAVEKELAAVKKEATKVSATKSGVSVELMGLKTLAKRTIAYTTALTKTDKVLNKPKKKKRRKKKTAV